MRPLEERGFAELFIGAFLEAGVDSSEALARCRCLFLVFTQRIIVRLPCMMTRGFGTVHSAETGMVIRDAL